MTCASGDIMQVGAATFHIEDRGHIFITKNYGPVVDFIKQALTISDNILERQ
jgi:hypothetical protein